eukprot:9500931-Pyramimonas_sp.AAC.1
MSSLSHAELPPSDFPAFDTWSKDNALLKIGGSAAEGGDPDNSASALSVNCGLGLGDDPVDCRSGTGG